MKGFIRAFHGAESMLSAQERSVLGQVIADVASMVSTAGDGGAGAEPGAVPGAMPGAVPGAADAHHGRSSDAEVLAALDFDLAARADEAPSDPGIARLVPPASRGDEAVAREFRRLTQADLRQEKATRLLRVWEEIETPTGRDGAVRVADGDEGLWLAALTDLRLFLSGRLGIETAQDVERVDALALGGTTAAPDDERGQVEVMLAGVYTAVGWWQESLLSALGP